MEHTMVSSRRDAVGDAYRMYDPGVRVALEDSAIPDQSWKCAAMTDRPTLRVTPLGAGQEVGRSCVVLQYRGKTVVCDAGIHPAHSGMAALPFIDHLDWSTVDAILITQYVEGHSLLAVLGVSPSPAFISTT